MFQWPCKSLNQLAPLLLLQIKPNYCKDLLLSFLFFFPPLNWLKLSRKTRDKGISTFREGAVSQMPFLLRWSAWSVRGWNSNDFLGRLMLLMKRPSWAFVEKVDTEEPWLRTRWHRLCFSDRIGVIFLSNDKAPRWLSAIRREEMIRKIHFFYYYWTGLVINSEAPRNQVYFSLKKYVNIPRKKK